MSEFTKANLRLTLERKGREARRSDGAAPVRIRINCCPNTTLMSTGVSVTKSEWMSMPKEKTQFIESLKASITARYYELRLTGKEPTSLELKESLTVEKRTLCQYYETIIPQLLSKDATIRTFHHVAAKIKAYGDVATTKITDAWIQGFCDFLGTQVSINTRALYVSNLKSVLKRLGITSHVRAKCKYEKVSHLTAAKVAEIESLTGLSMQQEMARDLFLFSASSGVSFADLHSFLVVDGWIEGRRKKSGVTFRLPLLPKAKMILDKYVGYLPEMSNQKVNRLLKTFAGNISFHQSRHTFATETLNAGVSMEVVSKVLGHKSMGMTHRYAKVLSKRVEDEFKLLV